jgi:hypothetical protein
LKHDTRGRVVLQNDCVLVAPSSLVAPDMFPINIDGMETRNSSSKECSARAALQRKVVVMTCTALFTKT